MLYRPNAAQAAGACLLVQLRIHETMFEGMSRHARRGMQTGKGLYRVSYVRHPAALTQASHDQESLISWLCRPTLALPRTSISHVTLHLT